MHHFRNSFFENLSSDTNLMQSNNDQLKVMALAIYEIRLLLSSYLGSGNTGDPVVRRAAHLAYALHNEAASIIEDSTFEIEMAITKLKSVDQMFKESYAPRFAAHLAKSKEQSE